MANFMRMETKLFYKWSTYRRLFKYSSHVIRIFESGLIKKYGQKQADHPPVFILGLPRSGSTFLYQLLTDMFDVLYFDNLTNLGRENLYFSTWLSQRLFKGRLHNSFSSTYGNTSAHGLHAPSEAGMMWYRWIPQDLVVIDEHIISAKQKADMAQNIRSIINRYSKPLIIKNLYFALRIGLIKKIIPEAKFIYLKRDPLYIAQSIYLARQKNTGDPQSEWWSLPYPGYESVLGLSLAEQTAKQVYHLENLIQEELRKLDAEKVLEIQYEELELEKIQGQFQSFIGTDIRKQFLLENVVFNPGNRQKLDDITFTELKMEIEKVYSQT